MDLPFQSEEDEKSLSSLQIEFENISEKNKKINNNNHLKEQLKTIDLHENKRLLAEHPELIDTSVILLGLGSWKSEKMHEEKMLEKYQTLAGMENATCPTCDGDIDQVL